MQKKANHYENVSLLVTHYNRSKSLERLLEHFDGMNSSFKEIVVSDDGSKQEHLEYIEGLKKRFDFKLVTTPQNKGLGNNINKGQDAVETEYVLYVQEDFIPLQPFDENFKNGLQLLEEDPGIDTVRFYAYLNYPNLKPVKYGFSEVIFDTWSGNLDKFAVYSDHPHVRRKSFSKKFGLYSEMKNPEKTELDMMMSFIQKKGRALLFTDFKTVFEQVNTHTEPSTMDRKSWRYKNNFFLNQAKAIYRHILFNYSLFLKKY